MGAMKTAFFSGRYKSRKNTSRKSPGGPRKGSSLKRARGAAPSANPYPKPGFKRRGSWKDTKENRRGAMRTALRYGRWQGWLEGRRGAKARFRPKETPGSLDSAVSHWYNRGYAEAYNEGRLARKRLFSKRRAKSGPRQTPKYWLGPEGVDGSQRMYRVSRRVTAEEIARRKYGSATRANVAAVRRNTGASWTTAIHDGRVFKMRPYARGMVEVEGTVGQRRVRVVDSDLTGEQYRSRPDMGRAQAAYTRQTIANAYNDHLGGREARPGTRIYGATARKTKPAQGRAPKRPSKNAARRAFQGN